MQPTPNTLLTKPLEIKQGCEVDMIALSDVNYVVSNIQATWPADTIKILKSRNTGLLETLERAENTIVSFRYIAQKPKQIQREFKKALAELERVGGLCGTYAARHIGR
jgi:hypothetical protein